MNILRTKYNEALSKLSSVTVLVIGDIILDRYLFGDVTRISPEAPVPVVLIKNEKVTLGGSGNVVKNLSSIGVKSLVMGRVGSDENAKTLKELLLKENVPETNIELVYSTDVPTIQKTRIIASNQQVCRVDRERTLSISQQEEAKCLELINRRINDFQGVLLSDYDKGYLTPHLITSTIEVAKRTHKFVSVDPQISHFFLYKGADILTPNHHEAGNALGKKIYTDTEIEIATKELAERLSSKHMMITRGDKGMTLYDTAMKLHYHIPTVAREVFDVTGAGDTVISIYTAFMLAGLTSLESALVSNIAAGIVVQKLGSSTVTLDELTTGIESRGLFI
jgi:D-glycero-beta-D-manno-heptose-7-phosphate kinase